MKAEFKDLHPADASRFVQEIIDEFELKGGDLDTLERILNKHEVPVRVWMYTDSPDADLYCDPKF